MNIRRLSIKNSYNKSRNSGQLTSQLSTILFRWQSDVNTIEYVFIVMHLYCRVVCVLEDIASINKRYVIEQ